MGADIEFIRFKRCIAHEKLPQFSLVNLANNELRKDEKFYKKIRYDISERELRFNFKKLNALVKDQQQVQNKIDLNPQHMLSQCDMNLLLKLINEKIAIVTREVKAIHEAKLLALGIQQQINTQFVNKRRQRIKKREAVKLVEPIFNLSSRELSETETRLLSKGLMFGIKSDTSR